MPAPILPSGGAHWIEPAGSGAASVATPVVLVDGPGVDEMRFITPGIAQYELVDTTNTGVYLLVAAGSFPGLPRLTTLRVGGDDLVY